MHMIGQIIRTKHVNSNYLRVAIFVSVHLGFTHSEVILRIMTLIGKRFYFQNIS